MHYRIRIQGYLDSSWQDWLGGLRTEQQEAGTPYQSALYGVLLQLVRLGLVLLLLETSRTEDSEEGRFAASSPSSPTLSKEKMMELEANKNNDEAEIKRVIESGIAALRAKDLDGVMAMYAPELVSFDIVPPLQYVGTDAYRKQWSEVFSLFPGPINYEIVDLSITVGNDVAFSHSFNRLSGTLSNGQKIGNWLRWTACFRKVDGEWRIAHMHASAPVDLATGKAVLDLRP